MDLVKRANRASASTIAQRIHLSTPDFLHPSSLDDQARWRVQIKCAHELSNQVKKQCFEMFESNMKQIYLRSMDGYNPQEKERELFAQESRFLLLSPAVVDQAPETIDGFLMWRFDFEECPSVEAGETEVAYCYEIQLKPSTRGKGLGKVLMETLERIGASWGMKKVMLTVQLENERALSFYRSLNFLPDEISPSQTDPEEEGGEPAAADYEILSKPLPQHPSGSAS